MTRILFLSLTMLLSCTGCATWVWPGSGVYDSRPISLQTFNLFDQRTPPQSKDKNWKGDWLFRRERLENVDRQLRNAKPDVVIFQQGLAKSGSPSETDRSILGFGALNGYEWHETLVKELGDSFEDQLHLVAVGVPVTLSQSYQKESLWPIGETGFVTLTVAEFEDGPVLILNVDPGQNWQSDTSQTLQVIDRIIPSILQSSPRFCPERLVIAGGMTMDGGAAARSKMLEKWQLMDASDGYCELASDCFTATPQNELFMLAMGNVTPLQADRILVHRTAVISSSAPVFTQPVEAGRYARQYGLNKSWAAPRYGWGANVRFAKCANVGHL